MKRILLPLLSIFLFISCNKKESRFPDGWNTVTYGPDFKAVFIPLQPHEQEFFLNADANDSLVTAEGVRMMFAAHSFKHLDGSLASGVVKIRTNVFFTNAHLLTSNLTTSLLNGAVLTNGGAFGIHPTSTDKVLTIDKGARISVPSVNSFDPGYHIFRGMEAIPAVTNDIAASSLMLWQQDTIRWNRGEYLGQATYDFSIYSLNFWGLLRNAYANKPAARLMVKLPDGYGNANSAVFAFLPGSGMIRLKGDLSSVSFTSENHLLPNGTPIKVLALANIGERLGYHLRTISLTGNSTIMVDEMKQVTARDLSELIKNELN